MIFGKDRIASIDPFVVVEFILFALQEPKPLSRDYGAPLSPVRVPYYPRWGWYSVEIGGAAPVWDFSACYARYGQLQAPAVPMSLPCRLRYRVDASCRPPRTSAGIRRRALYTRSGRSSLRYPSDLGPRLCWHGVEPEAQSHTNWHFGI